MIVLDTSALVEFLAGKDAVAEEARVAVRRQRVAIPHAADLECAAALRGLVFGGKIPEPEASRALQLLGRMRVDRYGHTPLTPRIWQLRHNMWPYDAAYAALAEVLDAELVTADTIFDGVPGLTCRIRRLGG